MAVGVVVLLSYYEAIRGLPDQERLQMYDSIVRYGLYGEIIDLPPVLLSLFALIKPTIDSSQNRYQAAKNNGSLPPKPGSNPRGRPPKNQTENQSRNQDIDSDSDIEKDSGYEKERERDSKGRTLAPQTSALGWDVSDRRREEMRRIGADW